MSTSTASTETIDLYREVHKGLRHAIFRATLTAGATDPTDNDAVAGLVDQVTGLVTLLRTHAAHEDRVIDPLVDRHVPGLVGPLRDAHDASEGALAILAATAAAIGSDAGARRERIAGLYDQLSDFCVSYLAHLRDEESRVMPALSAALTATELLDAQIEIRSQMPPAEMCQFLAVMVPAMNLDEKTAMLTEMQAAPPEIFDLFAEAARRALTPQEWSQLAARLART